MIRHTKATLDEVLNHRGIPAARGIARSLGTDFDPIGQLFAWRFGQFARPAWRPFVYQTGDTFHKEGMTVIANRLLTERQHLGDLTDAQVLSQGKQGMDAFAELQRAIGVGLLETAIELLAGERVQG